MCKTFERNRYNKCGGKPNYDPIKKMDSIRDVQIKVNSSESVLSFDL